MPGCAAATSAPMTAGSTGWRCNRRLPGRAEAEDRLGQRSPGRRTAHLRDPGSGTIFFSGCTLSCRFCQNFPISQLGNGEEHDALASLADRMLQAPESRSAQHQLRHPGPLPAPDSGSALAGHPQGLPTAARLELQRLREGRCPCSSWTGSWISTCRT